MLVWMGPLGWAAGGEEQLGGGGHRVLPGAQTDCKAGKGAVCLFVGACETSSDAGL